MFLWESMFVIPAAVEEQLRLLAQECYDRQGEYFPRNSPVSIEGVRDKGIWMAKGPIWKHTDYTPEERRRTVGAVLVNDGNFELFCGEYCLPAPVGSVFYIDASQEHGTDYATESERLINGDELFLFIAWDPEITDVPTPEQFLQTMYEELNSLPGRTAQGGWFTAPPLGQGPGPLSAVEQSQGLSFIIKPGTAPRPWELNRGEV